jgi:predicted phage terminase large subunit-like protein
LKDLLTPKWNKYIPHTPTLRQQAFLCVEDLDVFYGGAVGGGKSDALLMSALQYIDITGYEALILRRSFTDLSLPNAIMDRSKKWLMDTDAKWNEHSKTWTFPSGARLTFGHMDGPNDHYKYQSAEFHFIGIDEVSQFRWNQVTYMFSRLRKPKSCNIPIRFRGASNPGGVCHNELKERYINPKTRTGIFISAKLEDNPYLDREEYEIALSHLDPITRKQLRDGDWDVSIEGNIFPLSSFNWIDSNYLTLDILKQRRIDTNAKNKHIQEQEASRVYTGIATYKHSSLSNLKNHKYVSPVPVSGHTLYDSSVSGLVWLRGVVRFWDIGNGDVTTHPSPASKHSAKGGSDYSVGCRMLSLSDGSCIIDDIVYARGNPQSVERLVSGTADRDGIGVAIRMEQEGGSSGKSTIDFYSRYVLGGYDFRGIRSTGDKLERAKPLSAQMANGNVYVRRGSWNSFLVEQMVPFPHPHIHDDAVDACSGAYNYLKTLKKRGGTW